MNRPNPVVLFALSFYTARAYLAGAAISVEVPDSGIRIGSTKVSARSDHSTSQGTTCLHVRAALKHPRTSQALLDLSELRPFFRYPSDPACRLGAPRARRRFQAQLLNRPQRIVSTQRWLDNRGFYQTRIASIPTTSSDQFINPGLKSRMELPGDQYE